MASEKLPIQCFEIEDNLEKGPSLLLTESVGVVVTPSQLHVNPVLGCGGSIETILLSGKQQGTKGTEVAAVHNWFQTPIWRCETGKKNKKNQETLPVFMQWLLQWFWSLLFKDRIALAFLLSSWWICFILPSLNVPKKKSAPLRVTFDSVSNEGLDTAHL